MGTKKADIRASIDPVIKERAEEILSELGISASNAINIFYRQIILRNGLPFDVNLPVEKPLCMGELSEEELNAEIKKGYDDILAGRARPAQDVFDDIAKMYTV